MISGAHTWHSARSGEGMSRPALCLRLAGRVMRFSRVTALATSPDRCAVAYTFRFLCCTAVTTHQQHGRDTSQDCPQPPMQAMAVGTQQVHQQIHPGLSTHISGRVTANPENADLCPCKLLQVTHQRPDSLCHTLEDGCRREPQREVSRPKL